MKTAALLALAATLSAAPAPDVKVSPFRFSDLAIGTAPLLLSTAARPSTAARNSTAVAARNPLPPLDAPHIFPAAPIDLLAPAAERAKVMAAFQFHLRSPAQPPDAPVSANSGVRYFRYSPTDLIGPASDREKLIREFQSRW